MITEEMQEQVSREAGYISVFQTRARQAIEYIRGADRYDFLNKFFHQVFVEFYLTGVVRLVLCFLKAVRIDCSVRLWFVFIRHFYLAILEMNYNEDKRYARPLVLSNLSLRKRKECCPLGVRTLKD